MDYPTLKLTIRSHLENAFPDFVSATGDILSSDQQVDLFIRQAEEEIYNLVQLPAIRKNVLGNTITGEKYVSLPADYLAPFSLAVINANNEQTFLLNKDVSFIREAYPRANYLGTPVHYAQFDHNSLILGPTPDQTYGLEMHYYYYPISIVDAGHSWLGDNYESVLMNGAIVKGYIHMKGTPAMMQEYKTAYGDSLAILKVLGDGKNRRDAYRSGQYRANVQ